MAEIIEVKLMIWWFSYEILYKDFVKTLANKSENPKKEMLKYYK